MAHALLAPSSASRWLACPPSARLEEQFPDKESSFAAEGTLAHTLGELMIRFKAGMIDIAEYENNLAIIQADEYYNEAMHNYCEDYALFVLERLTEAQQRTPDAKLFLEHKLDMSAYVPDGFGTSDAVIIADDMMETIDLKYGKGVAVDVAENKQQMLYALGALNDFDFQYDIKRVRMTIYQPRIGNVVSDVMEVEALLNWAESELKPKAALAYAGEGDFSPGSHCGFCKAKAVCKALADYNSEVLALHDFKAPATLDDNGVAEIPNRADMIADWLKAVEEYALNEAVVNGKQWPGYKLVEGRSVRKYADIDKVAETLKGAGFDEAVLYKKELLTITNMEKAVGKKQFETLVGPLLIKPPGKPTLVPASDKRPAYNSTATAVADFSQQ